MAAPTCASSDVARLLLTRVGDPGGDFSASTHPTAVQVAALIAQVVVEVQAVVGADVDPSLASLATLTVATGVAAQVELSFTDDDAEDPASKYAQLIALYWGEGPDSKNGVGGRLGLLAKAQADIDSGGDLGTVEDPRPWATFPDPALVGAPVTSWYERY